MPLPIVAGLAAVAFRFAASPMGVRIMGALAESAPSAGTTLANTYNYAVAGAAVAGSWFTGPPAHAANNQQAAWEPPRR